MTNAVQKHPQHADFVNPLQLYNYVRAENSRIVSEDHSLQTVATNKICLSVFDNKRCILLEGIRPVPLAIITNWAIMSLIN